MHAIFLGLLIGMLGLSDHNVLMVNETGLKIVRIKIDGKTFEEVNNKVDQILVEITPERHDMTVVFRGGAHIDWPMFDFHGIHEVIFYRFHDKIRAHAQ